MEKAYAKLSWSYEGLDAGQTTDALIDMTGGIEETYEIKDLPNKQEFFNVIGSALAHDAMMGCSINADPNVREAKLSNGLVRGHAYAITAVVTLNVNGRIVRLIRCRNPWGNEVEWNGTWSDRDTASWSQIPAQDRQNLGQLAKADGEFWVFKSSSNYFKLCLTFHTIFRCHSKTGSEISNKFKYVTCHRIRSRLPEVAHKVENGTVFSTMENG